MEAICQAVGVAPDRVRRVVLDVKHDAYPAVYVELVGTGDLVEIDWPGNLTGARVTMTHSSEA
jgi:hypothetical protein